MIMSSGFRTAGVVLLVSLGIAGVLAAEVPDGFFIMIVMAIVFLIASILLLRHQENEGVVNVSR